MSAPGVPQPRRSAEEIDAEIRRVRAERPQAGSPEWSPEVAAAAFGREAELWREMLVVASGGPFALAVAAAGRGAEERARSMRESAAAIASAQANLAARGGAR